MARYTGSVCRLCRAEGKKLFLKGDRCNTSKCAIVRRSYRPGQHGQKRKKVSEYGIRLKEKQKMRRIYGLLEKQFRSYFEEANRRQGVTGDEFLRLLETRLDNVIFRLGFSTSRPQARQLVKHGHVLVNGKRVDIPSYHVKVSDKISINEKSQKFITQIIETRDMAPVIPAWLGSDQASLSGEIVAFPNREEIETAVQENLVVEYYSR